MYNIGKVRTHATDKSEKKGEVHIRTGYEGQV
jgi:hypothetical protein